MFLGQYSNTLQYENLTNNSGVELGSAAHRRAWEAGHIDYFGRDSFSNIQEQLERNIAQLPQQYHPAQTRQISTKTSAVPLQQITNLPKVPLIQQIPIKESKTTTTIKVKQEIIEEPPKTTISIQKPLKESVLSPPFVSFSFLLTISNEILLLDQ